MQVEANGQTFEFEPGTTEAEIGEALDSYFSKTATLAGEESAAPAAEGPGFLERSYNTAVQGASDAMSSLAGDNYNPDATVNDLDPASRTQKALFGDALGAAGSIAGDAVVSAGKAVLPEAAEKKIAQGYDAFMSSEPVQAVGRGIDRAAEAIGPEASRRVGELTNAAAVALPKAKVPGQGTRRVMGKAAKSLRDKDAAVKGGKRKEKVMAMLEPEDGYGRGETELNVAGTSQYTPTPDEAAVIDTVNALPEIRPGRSLRYNEAVVAKAARKEVEELTTRINKRGNPEVDTAKLNNEISEAFIDIEKTGFPMTGDVQKSAEVLIERARKFIDDSDGTANGVLQARRDFDTWARKNKPQVYSPDAESASGIAAKAVREAMNKHIDALVPSAKVAESLEKTHHLLKAKENLRPRAAKTAKTKVGRILEKMKGHLPTTPLAQWSTLGAGWAVATQPWVAALASLAGTGYLGAKAVQYGSREWRRALATAISGMEKSLKAGEMPAKLAAQVRADKIALVELLKDEREEDE